MSTTITNECNSPLLQSQDSLKHLYTQGKKKSWVKHVVVYIQSNDDLYITRMANITEDPREKLTIPLLRNEKSIFVSPNSSEGKELDRKDVGQYVATVKLGKVLKGYRIERFLGRVQSLYVFEWPLKAGPY